jgi:hypothetical protein
MLMIGWLSTHPASWGIAVASLILLAYAGSLWWLLRRESATVLLSVLVLCSVALSLRLVYTGDFPAGLNEDEPKMLRCGYDAWMSGNLLGVGCTELPVLLNALFQAPLVPVFGPGWWAIRAYSLVTSVLATAAAFAVARAMMLAVTPSLAVSAFVAVLPWSLFYGRVSVGGEMVFHELLLLAALARLVWAEYAGWVEVAIGSLGLTLLLYDYFCGAAMLAMPLVAALLSRGRRGRCLAVLVVALAGYLLYLHAHPQSYGHSIILRLDPQLSSAPLTMLKGKALRALQVLVEPVGGDWALTIRSAAIHPRLLLGLAVVGVLCAGWRAPFLLGGFAAGLVPALLSVGDIVSPHRMLMALPFIALSAGVALNLVRWPRWCVAVTVPIVLVVAVQSVRLYFSPEFWPPESRAVFAAERTDVVGSLPRAPHPHFIVMKQLGYHFGPQAAVDTNYESLTVDNWLPVDHAGTIYVFDPLAGRLRPFYEHLVGTERVRVFGRAFTVSLEAGQWSWIKRHGWAYEARCGNDVRRTQVPVLYHVLLGFETMQCNDPITHRWQGRWLGPTQDLRLFFNGAAEITTTHGVALTKQGYETTLDFVAQPDDEIRITIVTEPPEPTVLALLTEVTPMGEKVPLWEHVSPVPDSRSQVLPPDEAAGLAPPSDAGSHALPSDAGSRPLASPSELRTLPPGSAARVLGQWLSKLSDASRAHEDPPKR